MLLLLLLLCFLIFFFKIYNNLKPGFQKNTYPSILDACIQAFLCHLKLFRSTSEETGNTLSSKQSSMSMASQELHRKYHFCSVCKSCTMTLPTNLEEERKETVKPMIWKASALTPPSSPFSPPGWAASCVVVPQPDALQLPQTEGGSEQEQIHSPSLKDTLLGVGQVMGLAVSLATQQSDCHLQEISESKCKKKKK